MVLQYKREYQVLKEPVNIPEQCKRFLTVNKGVLYQWYHQKVTQGSGFAVWQFRIEKVLCPNRPKTEIKQLQGIEIKVGIYHRSVAKSDTFYLPVDTVYMDSLQRLCTDKYIQCEYMWRIDNCHGIRYNNAGYRKQNIMPS